MEQGAKPADSESYRLLKVRPGEWGPLLLSALYFFFVLSSYFMIRPIRETLAVGIFDGSDNLRLHELFQVTFLVMLAIVPLYGWLASHFPRRRFLPWVYVFFISNLLILAAVLGSDISNPLLARGFFTWVSVFNLFVVSVFWSFMADIFHSSQAKRLFGMIAAGGSAGAIVGPLLTAGLVRHIGLAGILLLSALLLSGALATLLVLIRRYRTRDDDKTQVSEAPMGGSIFAGLLLIARYPFLLGMTAFMLIGTFTGVMLYMAQAQAIADAAASQTDRAQLFASVDFIVNLATFLIQILLTARIVRWLGLALTLLILPLVVAAGFAALAVAPTLAMIVGSQVLRRAVLFGVANPASQMLYTVVGPQSKYKVKNFIDTVVYRGGDTLGSTSYHALSSQSGPALGVGAISGGIGVPLALIWALLAWWLGRRYQYLADRKRTMLP